MDPAVNLPSMKSSLCHISGYVAILESVKPAQKEVMLNHLSELMANATIYGWEPVGACHAVLLQQLENGHVDWGDEGKKLAFKDALVWNAMHCSACHQTQPLGTT